jgi:hypothetical protein
MRTNEKTGPFHHALIYAFCAKTFRRDILPHSFVFVMLKCCIPGKYLWQAGYWSRQCSYVSVRYLESIEWMNESYIGYLTILYQLQILLASNVFDSWNACYHAVQNLLSSRLLSENVKIKIYKTIILPFCGAPAVKKVPGRCPGPPWLDYSPAY